LVVRDVVLATFELEDQVVEVGVFSERLRELRADLDVVIFKKSNSVVPREMQ
jgi:hypothetical protein